MNPLISIIVPAYNAEKTIDVCLNSILNSTYKETEVLIIVDGATDRTKEYAEKFTYDKRVCVFEQENKGSSATRNRGLEIAKGEYVVFVDSDDVIHREMLEILLQYARTYDADIVQCKNKPVHSGLYEDADIGSKINRNSIKESLVNTEDFRISLFDTGKKNFFVTNKLFRRKTVGENRFRFREVEDITFCLDVAKNHPKILFIDCILYFYIQNPNSITHQKLGKYHKNCILNLKKIYQESFDVDKKLALYVSTYIVKQGLYFRSKACKNQGLYREFDEMLKEMYHSNMRIKDRKDKLQFDIVLKTFVYIPIVYKLYYRIRYGS